MANTLGEMFGCKVFHTDEVMQSHRVRQYGDSVAMDAAEQCMAELEGRSWIIDGYYEQCVKDTWLEESDKIVFLDIEKSTCFWRVIRRYVKEYIKYIFNVFKSGRQIKREEAIAEGKRSPPLMFRISQNFRDIMKHFRNIMKAEHNPEIETYYRGIGRPYSEKFLILRTKYEILQFLEDMKKEK